MRKWALIIAVVATFLGITLSLLSTHQHLRIQREGLLNESYCAISDTVNCDIVNASSYSEFLGVPIAWWGFVFYLVILGMSLYALFSGQERRATVSIAWLMSAGSILYSAYLAYISFVVLGVTCIECMGMYFANILLFAFLFVALKMPVKAAPSLVAGYFRALLRRRSGLGYPTRIASHAACVIIAFLVGWLVIINVQAKGKGAMVDVDVDDLVKYFYMQSLHSLEVDPEWTSWGNPNAKVTLVEFSEFQCPFCRVSAFNVRPYLQEFKNDIRYYFVNYPLDTACNDEVKHQMHPMACFASKAGICADKRGDFWSFHDDIFRNQSKLSRDFILDLAKKRGWGEDEFLACIESPEVEETIQKEIAAARKVYVTGTPTIFLNGRKLRYWRDPKFMQRVVKDEIKGAKKR